MTAIGIDVGGTKTLGVVIDPTSGEVIDERRAETGADAGGPAVLESVMSMAGSLLDGVEEKPTTLGIGIAEMVDLEGRVTSSSTIDWSKLDYIGRLNGILPTTIDSDVRCAAVAEARWGAGQSFASFGYVSVGTGIGGCLVLDGKPLAGSRGNAIVLGSGRLTAVCQSCGDDSGRVLEEFASGPGITAAYRATGGEADRCEVVFERAEAGDLAAQKVVDEAGRGLGVSVAFMVNVLDPEAVVIGGGIGTTNGRYRDAFERCLREHVWAEDTRELDVVTAGLDERSGAIGAALTSAATSCLTLMSGSPPRDNSLR